MGGVGVQSGSAVHIRQSKKADVRLPGKGNSNSHHERSVHFIITTVKWIRTSRMSIKNFPSKPVKSAKGAASNEVQRNAFREWGFI